tara:strand:+ start:1098 stop:1967 length:870 start_codon:yes stop_codon:yes gene_type:complete
MINMYFPKSQITTNLYTNGGTYVYKNSPEGEYYIGFYFKTSKGKYYTGKNPNDTPVQEIIPEIQSQAEDAEEGVAGSYTAEANLYLVPDIYAININLGLDATPPSSPILTPTPPTKEDYNIKEYQRYFASKNNEAKYIEINEFQYTQFKDELPTVDYVMYSVYSLPWLISGNRNKVYNINKSTVERTQKNNLLIGFSSYFRNKYDQYFQYTPGENLKTNGDEFLIQGTNKPYSGLYHIHPEKGPMVGAQHINSPHNYLIPISGSNIDYKINKTETQKNNKVINRISGGY